MLISTSSAIDLRLIAPTQRHSLVFGTFSDLPLGQAVDLIVDHDPRQLNAQFQSRFSGQFNWSYLEKGPEVWRVEITKTAEATPAASGSCCSGGGCCG
jgi:uncharacterized protein (DUF2249 family)